MKKTWNLKKYNKDLSPTEGILSSRGLSEIQIKDFLNTDKKELSPYLFADMEKAKNRILEAIEKNEKILIWGDFDCDGVTSSVILAKTLEALGANFSCFIPHRVEHGHGLNTKELVKFIAKDKIKLVVTVDCGISNFKEIQTLKGLKVETIITDHHQGKEENPNAFAIINPNAKNSIKKETDFETIQSLSNLTGAGIAYKLACAILDNKHKNLKQELVALSAIGTIGDVGSLTGENRLICQMGLKAINAGCLEPINKLKENLGLQGDINSETIAFAIVPRINASGRLSDASEAFEFLFSYDEFVVKRDIEKLNNLNSIRQALTDNIFEECLKKIKQNTYKNGIFLFEATWHIGIIGLVASKLTEKFNKPVFLASLNEEGMGRCSIRGVKPYNVFKILQLNSEFFEGFGGHELAGGFSFDPNKISFENLAEKLNSTLEEDSLNVEEAKIDIDFELNANEIKKELVEEISKLEPFGVDNEKPVFLLQKAKVVSSRQIGKDNSHLKLNIEKDNYIFECVWWKKASFKGEEGEEISLVFNISLNEFNGEVKIQLEIIDAEYKNENKKDFRIFDYRGKENILDGIENFIEKNPEIKVWAKKFESLNLIKDYKNITRAILTSSDINIKKLIFLDYPSNKRDFREIIKNENLEVLYLTKEIFSLSGEKYFEDLFKMLKFAQRKKGGQINIEKMGEILGIEADFVKYMLDSLSECEAIQIDENDCVSILNEEKIEDLIKMEIEKETFKELLNETISHKNEMNTTPINELIIPQA
ncbi:single-stranded-DNA-specific exonuclease RecJ [bacterium]|nr:single-stranded-DNA-specific exonuclease RecJ [bacterium]